jgi:hypothetical protein
MKLFLLTGYTSFYHYNYFLEILNTIYINIDIV